MKHCIMGKGIGPGGTIGIVAPAAPSVPERLTLAVAYLHRLGYQVVLGRSVQEEWGYLAGSDEIRAQDVNRFFADPAIHGILCLRGGYGAARILDLLDYDTIRKNPKLFIGFSDITALHTALRERCGLATIHGPMALSLVHRATAYTRRQFELGLVQPVRPGPFVLPPKRYLTGLVPGRATGPIVGGNMYLLSALSGTPYELDGTGCILFLEEIGEEAYSLDRMLRQFEQTGLISRVAALAFGDFTYCRPVVEKAGAFTVQEIVRQYARRWNKPALCGLPVGHGRHNGWLPLGVPAVLDARPDGTASLTIMK